MQPPHDPGSPAVPTDDDVAQANQVFREKGAKIFTEMSKLLGKDSLALVQVQLSAEPPWLTSVDQLILPAMTEVLRENGIAKLYVTAFQVDQQARVGYGMPPPAAIMGNPPPPPPQWCCRPWGGQLYCCYCC